MKKHILKMDGQMKAVPTPYCLQVDAFREIIERDSTDDKIHAQKELAYVYHMADPTSPYSDYEEELRREELINDLFDGDWEPDEIVETAIEVYEDINLTESQRLLKSAQKSVQRLREYFEEVDLTDKDSRGKPIWSAKDLIKNIGDLGKVVEGLQDLYDQVEKEQVKHETIRGNVERTPWNE